MYKIRGSFRATMDQNVKPDLVLVFVDIKAVCRAVCSINVVAPDFNPGEI